MMINREKTVAFVPKEMAYKEVGSKAEMVDYNTIYIRKSSFDSNYLSFGVKIKQKGLDYFLELEKTNDGSFEFKYSTTKYGYAFIRKNQTNLQEIFDVLKQIVIKGRKDGHTISEIFFRPATTNYSNDDLDNLTETILRSPKNYCSRNEVEEMGPNEIIKLYEELSGEEFEPDITPQQAALLRKKIFIKCFKKFLPDWKLNDQQVENRVSYSVPEVLK